MATYKEAKPLTIIKIFQESIKLLAKRSLTLPIFSIYISSLFILHYLSQSFLSPLLAHPTLALIDALTNQTRKLDFYVPIQKDIIHIIIVESISSVISFVISSILAIATIIALNDENLNFKHLISKLCQTFKGFFITKLYIGIFQAGYNWLALSSFAFLSLIYFPHFKISFAVLFMVQSLILFLVVSYLAIVWYVSVVLSVVEEECYELVAIGKAAKLLRGKRTQGTVIAFIELVAMVAFIGGYYMLEYNLKWFFGEPLKIEDF